MIEFIANEDATLTPIFMEEEVVEPPVSTNELSEDTVIRLFPNPAKDKLFLEAPDLVRTSFSIAIHNQLGQILTTKQINTGSSIHEINLEEIPDGFYYLVLTTNDNRFKTKKFVVRR